MDHSALCRDCIFSILFYGQEVAIIQLIIDTLEPLSIILAVLLFIKEIPERKRQFQYQAWSIIDNAQVRK